MRYNDNPSDQRHAACLVLLVLVCLAALGGCAPARDVTRPVGEWNTSRIIVRGRHVEHWMNGVQLLEYELGSADWTRRVEASKFAPLARYGREPSGHIAIQDHGDPVAYRNLKVRRLSAP